MSKGETRGRSRNPFFEMVAQQVVEWHQDNVCRSAKFANHGKGQVWAGAKEPAKEANAFRNSTAFKELKELYGEETFSIRTGDKGFVVCYRHEKGE
jgi:hypothetical protein